MNIFKWFLVKICYVFVSPFLSSQDRILYRLVKLYRTTNNYFVFSNDIKKFGIDVEFMVVRDNLQYLDEKGFIKYNLDVLDDSSLFDRVTVNPKADVYISDIVLKTVSPKLSFISIVISVIALVKSFL